MSSIHGTGSEWGVVVTTAVMYEGKCGGVGVKDMVEKRYRNDVVATGVTVNDEVAAQAFFVIQKNFQNNGVAATCAELGEILRNLGYIR